jgi:hypothetical protein
VIFLATHSGFLVLDINCDLLNWSQS